MSSIRRALPVLVAWGPLLSGCVAAGDASHRVLVTDSAGIRMVTNMDVSFVGGGVEWTVADRPELAIGNVAGADEYLFDQVMGVERLSDGRWVVADMGSSQLRFYDARGRHLGSSGRRGEGPEEFHQPLALYRLAGDTLAVEDSFVRLQLIDPAGRFVGTIRFTGSPAAERMLPIGALSDGTLLIRTRAASPQRITEPQTLAESYHLGHITRDGSGSPVITTRAPIGSWAVRRIVPGWRSMAQALQFDGPIEIGRLGDGLVVADPMTFELRFHATDGQLRTVSRVDFAPRSIAAEDMQRARKAFIELGAEGGGEVPPRLRQQRADVADAWVAAPHMPAFSNLLVDADDHVWLREYVPHEETVGSWDHTRAPASPSRWIVLAPDGAVVARVRLPGRFRPTVIGRDYVAGIFRDDMDVEYVHSYRLTRR